MNNESGSPRKETSLLSVAIYAAIGILILLGAGNQIVKSDDLWNNVATTIGMDIN